MDSVYKCKTDTIILIPPHTSIRHLLYQPCPHFYIHANLGYPFDSVSGRIFEVKLSATIKNILYSLKETDFKQQKIKLKICSAISLILSELPEKTWTISPKDTRLLKVLDVIHESFDKNLPNSELAKFAGLSTNAFGRLFKQLLDESPNSYLLTTRLKQACRKLLYTDQSIDEIAVSCGFRDRNYMSRLFKQKLNTSPAHYRKTALLPENF